MFKFTKEEQLSLIESKTLTEQEEAILKLIQKDYSRLVIANKLKRSISYIDIRIKNIKNKQKHLKK